MARSGLVRAASLLAAGALVAGLATLGLLASYHVDLSDWDGRDAVVVEIARPGSRAPERERPKAVEPPPEAASPRSQQATAAEAAAAPAQSVVINDPVWLSRPRHPERAYPRAAFEAGVEGDVALDCDVAIDGRLACVIVTETPTGWGFGEAALSLSREHVMAPPLKDGAPARGRYRMNVPFRQRQF